MGKLDFPPGNGYTNNNYIGFLGSIAQQDGESMGTKKQQTYGNDSISALKGADRVRKRPAVIFG